MNDYKELKLQHAKVLEKCSQWMVRATEDKRLTREEKNQLQKDVVSGIRILSEWLIPEWNR